MHVRGLREGLLRPKGGQSMNYDLYMLLIGGGLFLSLFCFLVGRMSAIKTEAKAEAERFVRVEAKLDSVQKTLDGINRNTADGFRWLHERIDHHLRSEHNMDVPSRGYKNTPP